MVSPLASPPSRVLLVAPRVGTPDGLGSAAALLAAGFAGLGATVTTAAGRGACDLTVAGLDPHSHELLDLGALEALVGEAELVVLDGVLGTEPGSEAARLLAALCANHPTLVRHHDLCWQLPGGADLAVADDPSWWQVTVNERSRLELAARGVAATTLYPAFDLDPAPGHREATRALIGLGPHDRLVLQPTRGAAVKNPAGGVALAAALSATYWLLGPVEEEFAARFERLREASPTPVLQGRPGTVTLADAYAACDVVVLPSVHEAFPNAAIEAAVARRPFAVAPFPVAVELRRYGFRWFDLGEPAVLARHLAEADPFVEERNELVARLRFDAAELPTRLRELLTAR